ncbi:Os07g0542067 [Oryza sativa Japonica Group]|uniref:Os07g0542067 protein n=1 Tax=Oryza sativa subsp. japonica TaxID=39947 RepID=A0A0P0X7L0_ORYSJ|nr:hypothetical protein EE612_039837 [Oryza sativa]BAT01976.1 Os07g0542067 [Oryza sativa Japonica Group]
MSCKSRQSAGSIAVKQNHDICHCRPIYRVLLHAQETDAYTFQQLSFRVVSSQGVVSHLYNISLFPVPPILTMLIKSSFCSKKWGPLFLRPVTISMTRMPKLNTSDFVEYCPRITYSGDIV